jgi:hypothetical protein
MCRIITVFSGEDDGIAAWAYGGLCHFHAFPREVDLHTEMHDSRANHTPKASMCMEDVSAPTGEHVNEELYLWSTQVDAAMPVALMMASGDLSVF